MRDVLLSFLAKEPSHGYELRARLQNALGPLGEALNAGQIYVTLARLERAGLVTVRIAAQSDRPDRKIYELTAAGHERVRAWVTETAWPKPATTDFHLKLVAVAAAGLADPVRVVDQQRRELLHQLRAAQRAVLDAEAGGTSALLLGGIVLRLEADLRWLDECAEHWTRRASR